MYISSCPSFSMCKLNALYWVNIFKTLFLCVNFLQVIADPHCKQIKYLNVVVDDRV